jgi:hypothetical protein
MDSKQFVKWLVDNKFGEYGKNTIFGYDKMWQLEYKKDNFIQVDWTEGASMGLKGFWTITAQRQYKGYNENIEMFSFTSFEKMIEKILEIIGGDKYIESDD